MAVSVHRARRGQERRTPPHKETCRSPLYTVACSGLGVPSTLHSITPVVNFSEALSSSSSSFFTITLAAPLRLSGLFPFCVACFCTQTGFTHHELGDAFVEKTYDGMTLLLAMHVSGAQSVVYEVLQFLRWVS